MRILILSLFFALSAQAGQGVVEGKIGRFHMELGEDVGVEIINQSGVTLVRICQPTKPGIDVTPYLYDRLKTAQLGQVAQCDESTGATVKYEERMVQDTITKRNKLCLIELVY